MTQIDLQQFAKSLPGGTKAKLAAKLNCDPAKITKAFKGLVRNKKFMTTLIREANKLRREPQPA